MSETKRERRSASPEMAARLTELYKDMPDEPAILAGSVPPDEVKPKTCVCGDTEGTNDDCERCTLLSHLAAERERANAVDNPNLDCTDAAHPAWWRGCDHGSAGMIREVQKILDGQDDGSGTCNEPWESVRRKLIELCAAQERVRELERTNESWEATIADELQENLRLFAVLGIDKTALDNMPPGQHSTGLIIERITALQEQQAAQAAELERVKGERDEAQSVVRETLWMAGRYADGRATYAVEMYNAARQKAVKGGYAGDAKEAIDGHDPERATLQERAEIAETALAASQSRAERAEGELAKRTPPPSDGCNRLNRPAYEKLIAENIEWLKTMPRTLERDHILVVLQDSPNVYYGYPTPTPATTEGE